MGSRLNRTPPPCAVVVFGASGDLARRKLLPALYNLALQQLLPPEMVIVGISRSAWSDAQFRDTMKEAIGQHSRNGEVDEDVWHGFARRLGYLPGSFDDNDTYTQLDELLTETDASLGTRGNRLYYLATAPEFFPVIAARLGAVGLSIERNDTFRRLVIEKPFGHDLRTARELNSALSEDFDESQIYRIDHYLGKEAVQNLLVLRFGNLIFEPLWNRGYVDHVQITASEDLGVEERGGYYDSSGALRDIIQNHLLQLMSIVAMEPPARFASRDIHAEKVKLLRAVRPITGDEIATHAVRGQYGPGYIAGRKVTGYRQEDNVDPASNTETYAALKLQIDNWRWAGTPFYLRAAKRLPKRSTEIAVQFRSPPHLPFVETPVDAVSPNLLTIRIQPDEGASLKFVAKVPGPRIDLRTVGMDFAYGSSFLRASPEAYERLLLDALVGDATLFTRWDEVEAAWKTVDDVVSAWAATAADFPNYAAGSWGPDEADGLLARDGRRWRRL